MKQPNRKKYIKWNDRPYFNYSEVSFKKFRSDALVGKTADWLATEILGLPAGSVCLLLPNGRVARSDKKLGRLREDWEVE